MAHVLLFGGTFDPVHHGHLLTALCAQEQVGAERVLFMPAGVSPLKQGVKTAGEEHRLAMLRLAIAGRKGWAIDEWELRRTGPSYTYDTLVHLREAYAGDRWTMLMGADQLGTLHHWYRVKEILEMTRIALLPRPGYDAGPGLKMVAEKLGQAAAEALGRSFLTTPQVDISATGIRRRVEEGKSIAFFVPREVEAYIVGAGLYM